jgi:hypothetical protein
MALNLVDVYQYHPPPKMSLQNSTHNLNFEVYFNFSYIVTCIFLTQIYFIRSSVCWNFFLNILV